MKETCFWMIRRKDTQEWYRPNRGPVWAKCGNWTKDREKGKAYGKLGYAKQGWMSFAGDNRSGTNPEIEIVRFRTFEEGVEL
jgi:hypothetical protein